MRPEPRSLRGSAVNDFGEDVISSRLRLTAEQFPGNVLGPAPEGHSPARSAALPVAVVLAVGDTRELQIIEGAISGGEQILIRVPPGHVTAPVERFLAFPGRGVRADKQNPGRSDVASPRLWHIPPAAPAEALPADYLAAEAGLAVKDGFEFLAPGDILGQSPDFAIRTCADHEYSLKIRIECR